MTTWDRESPRREYIAALEACGTKPTALLLAAMGHPNARDIVEQELVMAGVTTDGEDTCPAGHDGEGPCPHCDEAGVRRCESCWR
ncbi:MAG: hypothetical protein EPN91_09825 [Salinibacterium sp.]|nr:MAG: hypothetical protein EPN91_09825 [Salinibacterium sp.]